uniref:ER-bound oxygenase mpaB/mpaB'/Rubber oxygenase catalytic domain-containing protein n=1 Tax=Lygus hesperus TaxID=30085 RepID=A0A146LW50_LYGHE
MDSPPGSICCADNESAERKASALVECIMNEGKDVPLDEAPVLLPGWYNHSLVTRGQEYFTSNIFCIMAAKLSGLVGLLSVPSILKILMDTNKSSSPPKAYKRYMETINHMIEWYQSDLRNPNSKGRKSILNVRRLHSAANMKIGRITQKDLAITQFGFIGFALTCPEVLGLPQSGQEGLVHFWRVIGHLIGIKDRYNLFQGCKKCSTAACKMIVEKVYGPGTESPPEHYNEMTDSLLKGMWPVMPIINPVAYREMVRRMCGLSPKQLPWLPQTLLNVQLTIHKLASVQLLNLVLVPYLNFQMWLTLFFQRTAPFLAFIAFHDFWT